MRPAHSVDARATRPTGGRWTTPTSRRSWRSIATAAARAASTPAFSSRCDVCWRARRSSSGSRTIRRRRRRAAYRVSDIELASRLSYFLWSSMPDDALLDLAAAGTPAPAGRARRAGAPHAGRPEAPMRFVENFAGQWLHIRNLRNMAPNTDEFPDFDNDLRDAFRRETELFFASVMREDRNVLDLMRADYTFVNERLAKHYGLHERLRQSFPPRHAHRRCPPRPARQGQHPAGDLARRSHARRRCAASGFWRICSASRRRRRRPKCRRCSRCRAFSRKP